MISVRHDTKCFCDCGSPEITSGAHCTRHGPNAGAGDQKPLTSERHLAETQNAISKILHTIVLIGLVRVNAKTRETAIEYLDQLFARFLNIIKESTANAKMCLTVLLDDRATKRDLPGEVWSKVMSDLNRAKLAEQRTFADNMCFLFETDSGRAFIYFDQKTTSNPREILSLRNTWSTNSKL